MAKAKEKSVEEKKKKRAVDLDAGVSKEKSSHELDSMAIAEYWHEEVLALKDVTYKSEEEALDAIAERVTARLNTPEKLREPTKEFLTTLIGTDVGIMEELRQILKIRGS